MAGRTSVYSSSVGKSIQASANQRDSQKVGCTGPIKQARPPSLITLHVQHVLVLVSLPVMLKLCCEVPDGLSGPGHHSPRSD